MKNTLADLNNYLFEQLERLNDDDMTPEQMEAQLKKTDAIVKVSEKIIQNGELALRTMKHVDDCDCNAKRKRAIPAMLSTDGGW